MLVVLAQVRTDQEQGKNPLLFLVLGGMAIVAPGLSMVIEI